jgi:hypothetical protein
MSEVRNEQAIEPPVCPACKRNMRLSRIDRHPDPDRSARLYNFQCDCGYRYTMTIEQAG